MPCNDGGYTQEQLDAQANERSRRLRKQFIESSTLCGVLTVLKDRCLLDDVLASVDWKEAGVSHKEAVDWWIMHQLEDSRRRSEEAKKELAAKKKNAARQDALRKLTEEDKRALGL